MLKTPSYTPQVDIENLNGQIRRMLMHLFVRQQNQHWTNAVGVIEGNLNNYNVIKQKTAKQEPKQNIQPIKYEIGD